MELNGTDELVVYTDDVNLLGKYHKEKHRSSIKEFQENCTEPSNRIQNMALQSYKQLQTYFRSIK
jgi:hypothetical protein